MTKTLSNCDLMMVYNQLLANCAPPVVVSSTSEQFTCNVCGGCFTDKDSLMRHELGHNQIRRRHECKECGKKFNSSSDLKRHSLIHTNTRPYKCHLCPTAFVQQAHLTRHLKSHTRHGVRFKCLGCGTMFLHSTNVRWHQQFCEQAQGVNGGYVVTQSDGEGLDSVPNMDTQKSPEDTKTSSTWARGNKIYYFDGPYNKTAQEMKDAASPKTHCSSQVDPLGARGISMLRSINKNPISMLSDTNYVKTEGKAEYDSPKSSPTSPLNFSEFDQNVISNAHLLSNENLIKLLTILQPSHTTLDHSNNFGVPIPRGNGIPIQHIPQGKGIPINLAPIKLHNIIPLTQLNNFTDTPQPKLSPPSSKASSNIKLSSSTLVTSPRETGLPNNSPPFVKTEMLCNSVRVSVPPFNTTVKIESGLKRSPEGFTADLNPYSIQANLPNGDLTYQTFSRAPKLQPIHPKPIRQAPQLPYLFSLNQLINDSSPDLITTTSPHSATRSLPTMARLSPPSNRLSPPQQPFIKHSKSMKKENERILTPPNMSPNNAIVSSSNQTPFPSNQTQSPSNQTLSPSNQIQYYPTNQNMYSPSNQTPSPSNQTPDPLQTTPSPSNVLSPEHITQLMASNSSSVTDKFQSLLELIKSLISEGGEGSPTTEALLAAISNFLPASPNPSPPCKRRKLEGPLRNKLNMTFSPLVFKNLPAPHTSFSAGSFPHTLSFRPTQSSSSSSKAHSLSPTTSGEQSMDQSVTSTASHDPRDLLPQSTTLATRKPTMLSPRDPCQPISEEISQSRDTAGPTSEEQADSQGQGLSRGNVQQNIEQCNSIAFHNLRDLLALV